MPLKEKYFSAFTGSPAGELDRREPRLRGYLAGVQDMIFRVRAGRMVKISRADNMCRVVT